MGLVYAFLAAWVSGGVLLGARLLLQPAPQTRTTLLAAAGLAGFGLFGLVAEGSGLATGAWAGGWALGGGALFLGACHALRPRAPQAVATDA